MEKWSVNSISVWLIADFSKKNLVEEDKTQKLKKSAIYEGDLEEHWLFSGKEVKWTEGNLCRNTFPFEETYYTVCTGLHLCSFLLFFQMLIKYLKINVLLYEWTALSRLFFRHGFTSLFIVKGERFYDYFSVTIFLGKNSNFLATAPPTAPHPHPCAFLLVKAIPFNRSHCFYLFPCV